MSFNEEKEEQIMESSYSKTVSISGLSDKYGERRKLLPFCSVPGMALILEVKVLYGL